jgi:hypothetical protein
VIEGDRSSPRFPAGQELNFVVRVQTRDLDPKTWLHFWKWNVTKGHRELPVARITSKTNDPIFEQALIPLDIQKYGLHSWKFRPTTPLGPGEYQVSTMYALGCWAFGID